MKSVAVALLCVSAGTAAAGVINRPAVLNDIHTNLTMQVDQSFQGGATDVVARRYDLWNTTAPVSSTLTSVFRTGGQEIADDLNLTPQPIGSAGWLDTLGFAVGNATGNGALTGGVVRIAFYDQATGNVIPSVGGFTGFTANLPVLNLTTAGASSRINFPAGGLKSLGWYFGDTNAIYASLTVVSVLGTLPLADVGMQTRASATPIGSSTDNMVGVTTGPNPSGAFNFAGNPVANSAWFIDTDTVPAPGSLALLGLAGLVAARRRRA